MEFVVGSLDLILDIDYHFTYFFDIIYHLGGCAVRILSRFICDDVVKYRNVWTMRVIVVGLSVDDLVTIFES